LENKEATEQVTFSPSFSLRQKGLAQASSFRLGESWTSRTLAFSSFSLRRDFSRLSETFARSKHG